MQKIFIVNSGLSAENTNRILDKINTYVGTSGVILSVTPTSTKDCAGSWLVVAENNINDPFEITKS